MQCETFKRILLCQSETNEQNRRMEFDFIFLLCWLYNTYNTFTIKKSSYFMMNLKYCVFILGLPHLVTIVLYFFFYLIVVLTKGVTLNLFELKQMANYIIANQMTTTTDNGDLCP